jgi:hypothetical protein
MKFSNKCLIAFLLKELREALVSLGILGWAGLLKGLC